MAIGVWAPKLRHRGLVVNAKKVRRLMRMQALNPKQRRRFVMTTDSDHNDPIYPNLAANMALDGPNQLWVAGISPMSPSRPASCIWLSFSMPGPVGR